MPFERTVPAAPENGSRLFTPPVAWVATSHSIPTTWTKFDPIVERLTPLACWQTMSSPHRSAIGRDALLLTDVSCATSTPPVFDVAGAPNEDVFPMSIRSPPMAPVGGTVVKRLTMETGARPAWVGSIGANIERPRLSNVLYGAVVPMPTLPLASIACVGRLLLNPK